MKAKSYFIAPTADMQALTQACITERSTLHTHTIGPNHTSTLAVIYSPTATVTALIDEYLVFPDINDQRTNITAEHIAAFPASVNLTTDDNTYSAMTKIHATLGMAAMHPLG